MSGIWGAISLKDDDLITKNEIESLSKPFQKCVIDRTEELLQNTLYMGTGIQYFTPESKNEKLPINDQGQYFYNGDVIIDNREELLNRLELIEEETLLPDGSLQYMIYHKLGKEALNIMLGAYAFVYYDRGKRQVTIATDALGNRCVYYTIHNGKLYYSSLLESLINVKENRKINGRWICDFLALDFIGMFTELEETPIDGVYRVAPGQVVVISEGTIEKEVYWSPEKVRKELHYQDDITYKKHFRKLYKQAVESMLRSEDKISILLSGGLDSTSVACIAARKLKAQGRTLYSYTSIPEKGYHSEYGEDVVVDESEDVLKTKEYLGNVEPRFIRLENVNPWHVHKKELSVLEMPYKSVENVLWIEEAMHQAYKNGSRIMLTGEYGNTTVSYTDLEFYLEQFLKHGRFIKFYQEFDAFYTKIGFSRKSAILDLFNNIIYGGKNTRKLNCHDKSYVSTNAVIQYETDKRIGIMDELMLNSKKNYSQRTKLKCNKRSLRQIGEIGTKLSLVTGVIHRDPTKDKRIFEFCISLPLEQFVKNGEERRLITCYLRDIMPRHVFRIDRHGRQSADLKYRFQNEWTDIRNSWINLYKKYEGGKFVDCKKAIANLEENTSIDQFSDFDLTRHMYTLMCLEYISLIEK